MSKSSVGGEMGSGAQEFGRMMSMITGYWVTQVVRSVAVFNIADHVAAGVSTAEAIAKEESADPDAMRRLLRTCASLGMLTSQDGVRYAGTPLVNTLRRDSTNSLRGFAASQAAPGHWQPWGRFPDAIRTGTPQTHAAYGTPVWDYFVDHPDESEAFTAAMANLSMMGGAEVARVLDTKGVRLAVDVGGAGGDLVHSLMQVNEELHGVVLDRPDVAPGALAAALAKGLSGRFSVQGGDFFEEVPPADLYLLKYILHDWNDEECVRILTNCRANLAHGGRVAIVEHLVGGAGEPGIGPLMDMNMLVMLTGRERDVDEFDALLAAAGLRRTTITPAGDMAVIEAEAPAL